MVGLILTALGLAVTLAALAAGGAWRVSAALRDVRDELAKLKVEVVRERGDDRLETERALSAAIRQHVRDCPLRETTGVRSLPVSQR